MNQTGKGHIRGRGYSKERLLAENMRRVLVAALVSVVLFCMVWFFFIITKREKLDMTLGWTGIGISFTLQLLFAGICYWLMYRRKSERYETFTRSYWIMETLFFCAPIFLCQRQVVIMFQLLMMFLALAMIPILQSLDQIIVASLEAIMILSQILLHKLDLEHAFYALLIAGLCNLIARQSYMAFLRQTEDATRINSAKSQAETDPMTKLLNRRGLERRIAYIWPMCLRQKLDVAVIMLDIDNFKKFNDSFGHAEGDECIKAVAKVLLQHTKRKTDYAARVGGEEFLIFLPGISQTDALLWAENCKKEIEGLRIKQSENNFLPFVSVSMGICHLNPMQARKEFWELRNEADRSLYQAKEAGRACIFIGNQCYYQTLPEVNRRQYMKEKMFRSI